MTDSIPAACGAPQAPDRPSADPCAQFLRQLYERVPDALHLVPVEDLLEMARVALTDMAAA